MNRMTNNLKKKIISILNLNLQFYLFYFHLFFQVLTNKTPLPANSKLVVHPVTPATARVRVRIQPVLVEDVIHQAVRAKSEVCTMVSVTYTRIVIQGM